MEIVTLMSLPGLLRNLVEELVTELVHREYVKLERDGRAGRLTAVESRAP